MRRTEVRPSLTRRAISDLLDEVCAARGMSNPTCDPWKARSLLAGHTFGNFQLSGFKPRPQGDVVRQQLDVEAVDERP